ncbi:MAG: 2-hydroxyacid dehydrogenase [Sporomusaceae bacterium]|nr:2-hydroxyacid dehydrogenase [Sporomusaceae bacterium]
MPIIVSLVTEDKFAASRVTRPEGWNIRFLDSASEDEIIAACHKADFLLAAGTAAKISAKIVDNIPDIKLIQTIGVGVDHIDIPASIRMGIPVANVPGQNASSVAEYTIGTIIALQRRIIEAGHEIQAGNYSPFRNSMMANGLNEIRGSKVGLIGFGAIGREVARIAVAMGATVSYYASRRHPPDIEAQYQVQYKVLNELLATSDIISLHLPETAETRGLIGFRQFMMMPDGSIFVNTARGGIVDQEGLAKALEAGHLAGAAIDTFSPEPPAPDHPLLHLSPASRRRVILTPHIAGATANSFKRMIEAALANIGRLHRGERPENVVNGIFVKR